MKFNLLQLIWRVKVMEKHADLTFDYIIFFLQCDE